MSLLSNEQTAFVPSASDPEVLDHIGLARSLARRFDGRGEDADDLRQVALLGLVKAQKRFDPEYGVAFSTYASTVITGELKRHFRDKRWAVHVSRSQQERYLAVRDSLDQLSQHLGRPPTIVELADATGLPIDQVLEAQELAGAFTAVSLDGNAWTDRGEDVASTLGHVEDAFDLVEQRAVLGELIDRLGRSDRQILALRFGLGLSQCEIAEELGVSQMHVSRMLRSVLNRLRIWADG